MSPTLLLADSQLGIPAPWEIVIGRLHPMVVHFPIALLLVALVLETWGLRKRGPVPSPAALPCLVFGAMGAFVAGLSGWLLHEHEPPGRGVADLVEWHEWLGIAVALAAPVAAILALSGRKGGRPRSVEASRFILCFVCVFVGIGGHLGGKMVHGREYLTGPLWEALGWSGDGGAGDQQAAKQAAERAAERAAGQAAEQAAEASEALDELAEGGEPAPSAEGAEDPGAATAPAPDGVAEEPVYPIAFARDVAPIFVASCVECHGASKAKGGLRLDLPLDEGETPYIVVPGEPDASELIARVELPHDDMDIMPAKGDPLTVEQIATLRRWVSEGAPWGDR